MPTAAIDYASVTTGLTGAFESGVTQVLPVVGVILGAGLVVKAIRRFAK
jgi:hypothetical protein